MSRTSTREEERSRLAHGFAFMTVIMLAFLLGIIAAGVRFAWV